MPLFSLNVLMTKCELNLWNGWKCYCKHLFSTRHGSWCGMAMQFKRKTFFLSLRLYQQGNFLLSLSICLFCLAISSTNTYQITIPLPPKMGMNIWIGTGWQERRKKKRGKDSDGKVKRSKYITYWCEGDWKREMLFTYMIVVVLHQLSC